MNKMKEIKTGRKSKSIKGEFFHYVSLSILGILGTFIYVLVDTYFISKAVGSQGLAALNIAIPVYNVLQAVGMMVGIGAATRYALTREKESFTNGFYLVVIGSAILLPLGLFWSEGLSKFLGADEEILHLTSIYLKVILSFTPMFLMNYLFLSFVRNDGKPKLVMMAMVIGSLMNIILDYVLIFTFDLGMFGAALATGIAPLVSMMILFRHVLKKENTFHLRAYGMKLKAVGKILSPGLSTFVTELSGGIVIFTFNMILLSLVGNVGVAAYGVIANISIIVMATLTGLAQGMQPLLSREHRLGERKGVREVYRLGIMTSIGLSLGVYLVAYFFTDEIISVFNSENNVRMAEIARPGMRLYFTAFFFTGLNIIQSAYYSAIGSVRFGFMVAILRGLVVILPVVLLMSFFFGVTGVWLSLMVTDLSVFVLVKWKNRRGKRLFKKA